VLKLAHYGMENMAEAVSQLASLRVAPVPASSL
jgi:hypothetical protein